MAGGGEGLPVSAEREDADAERMSRNTDEDQEMIETDFSEKW